MTSVSRLDVYEIAYLCGGPERVAMAAVVAMQQDGRIRISPTRNRIQVVHRRASRPIETAVLDAVPASGTVLGPALRDIAKSGAVGQLIEELRGCGLIGQHAVLGHPQLSAAGRQARKDLEDSSATMRREGNAAAVPGGIQPLVSSTGRSASRAGQPRGTAARKALRSCP